MTRLMVGAGAQLLTLGAMVLPIAFGQTSVLPAIIEATAIVGLLLHSATLAIAVRFPAAQSAVAAKSAVVASFVALTSTSTLLAFVALVCWGFGGSTHWAGVIAVASVALFTAGGFTSVIAAETRKLRTTGIHRARFEYGLTTCLLTLVCCLLEPPGAVYVLANAAGYSVAVAAYLMRHPGPTWAVVSFRRQVVFRTVRKEMRNALPLVASYGLAGVATQAPMFAVTAAGSLQGAWAVAIRVLGGMQTIGSQLLGPQVDVRWAALAQGRADWSPNRTLARSFWVATIVSVGFLAVVVAALTWVGEWPGGGTELGALMFALAGYGACYSGLSAVGRALGIVGSVRERLIWDLIRTVMMIAVITCLSGTAMLYGVGIVGLSTAGAYWLLLARSVAKRQRVLGITTVRG